jgi:ribonuclease E
MSKQMLINAVHAEQKRMAIVEDGKLVEFNIQMTVREPTTGNIYKGIVLKVERGLHAAFVNYSGKKDGFLPLRDVRQDYFTEVASRIDTASKPILRIGQEVLVQVIREEGERKGALLTTYISLPGRYLVLLPHKESSGISRKIESEEDRKHIKDLINQIKIEEGFGFIVRTAGINRTKQELARDYQHLYRLWREIQKKASSASAPSLIYQESDFGVRSLRDYFTTDIQDILVDDIETCRQMRAYCKAVMPRNTDLIKHYKEKEPIFNRYRLEEQIRVIYEERVELKSGGYIVISPTEAMTTIDVNSGRASNRRSVEETAFKVNIEAAEEVARQLRLRDLGGLIVIDFIDMMDRKNEAEVEKTFKKAISIDRSRIQLSKISKFGILELSRQKKQSTIQEISYTTCPYCQGRGVRPSLEYTALSAFRRIQSEAVRGTAAILKVTLPHAVSDYLLNQKRDAISKLEIMYGLAIHVFGNPDMAWHDLKIDVIPKVTESLPAVKGGTKKTDVEQRHEVEEKSVTAEEAKIADAAETSEGKKRRPHRRTRHHRRYKSEKIDTAGKSFAPETTELPESHSEMLSDISSQQIPSRPAVSAKPARRKKRSSHRRSVTSTLNAPVSDEAALPEESEDEVSLFRWY